ncbi:GAF and ANTAR domain-containing protein [Pseudokineococcus basanitobsidens]|uniref:GAF and ANTAR domain-containing protein n=1 Tax=Pseudokineococcus basanitobsidens TaxID=1926649 RepID=A0ABU8RL06_9ACTN
MPPQEAPGGQTPPPSTLAQGPTRPGDRSRALAELARISLDQPLGEVLQQVVDLAVEMLDGVRALSVTLVDDGSTRSAAFSDPVAARLDERQYEDGFGPCTDAARSGGVVRVRDTAHEETYPGFAALARRYGVRSVTSVGMPWGERVVGALNLYVVGEDPLPEDEVELARTFAGYAAAALANAALYASTAELAEQMQRAMASRAVIEQAKGVLVAALGVDPEEAFAELSRRSQRSNTKLRDVAAELVAMAQRRSAAPRARWDGARRHGGEGAGGR